MLATPGALPSGSGWAFEVKWDGMRLLADVGRDLPGQVRLLTRSGRDVTSSFPELARLDLIAPDVVLDGEVVMLDHGVPSFAALAERMHGTVSAGPAGDVHGVRRAAPLRRRPDRAAAARTSRHPGAPRHHRRARGVAVPAL